MSTLAAPALSILPAFVAALRRELRADWPVYALVAAYALAGAGWLAARGALVPDAYLNYAHIYGTLLAGPLWLSLLLGGAVGAIVIDPKAPFGRLRSWCTPENAARLAAGLPLATAAMVFFGTYTTLKTAIAGLGFHADPLLADLDRFLHFGMDPGVALHAALDPAWILPFVDGVYASVWGVWFYGFMLWMAFGPDQRDRRVRYFLTLFLAWALVGTALAAAGSSGGPCFYGFITGDTARFAPVMAAIRDAVPGGTSAAVLQDYLWSVQTGGAVGIGTGISAFPSIHVTLVAVNALFAFERSRIVGVPAALLVPVIMFGSVYLGWHYALDGYVSLLVVGLVYAGLRRLESRSESMQKSSK
jgi:hypothetical protein